MVFDSPLFRVFHFGFRSLSSLVGFLWLAAAFSDRRDALFDRISRCLGAIMSGWGKGGSGSASGWKGRWNSKGNPKGGKGKLAEKRDFAKKVPWENRLSKWFLRPYVEQGGSPFSGGRGVAESSLLTSWHLSNVLDETCSEYCARQGIALSEGAANCEVGAFLLQYHFADRAATEGLKKAGIEQLLKALQSPEGKKFLESCHYLNTAHTDVDRSEAATTQAVKRFVRFFTADRADKEVAFRQALRFAARLYLFAFEGLEALTDGRGRPQSWPTNGVAAREHRMASRPGKSGSLAGRPCVLLSEAKARYRRNGQGRGL